MREVFCLFSAWASGKDGCLMGLEDELPLLL